MADTTPSVYSFTRCQRPDGTLYGTSGKCRSGVEISKVETGFFVVNDPSGKRVGTITTDVGGGAVEARGGRSSARYTASLVGRGAKSGLTLAQAKAWVKDQLGEKIGGDVKISIKGGMTAKGKAKRLKNIDEEIADVRGKYNQQVAKWNSIPKEDRRNFPNLRKNIEYLRAQHDRLLADRKIIQDTPLQEP